MKNDKSIFTSVLLCHIFTMLFFTVNIEETYAQTSTTPSVSNIYGQTKPFGIEIASEDDEGTNAMSAYLTHRFHIDAHGTIITGHQWEYLLPLKDGSFQTVVTTTDEELEIPVLQNPDNYQRTGSVIYGKILFSGQKDGETVSSAYIVGLQLKPMVLEAEITSIEQQPNWPYTFTVNLAIRYVGTSNVTVMAYENSMTGAYTYFSNIPDYTTMALTNLELWEDTTLDIQLQNSYGSSHHYLIVPADGILNDIRQPQTSEASVPTFFSPLGNRLPTPRKGLNIIKTKDGQTRKVLMR